MPLWHAENLQLTQIWTYFILKRSKIYTKYEQIYIVLHCQTWHCSYVSCSAVVEVPRQWNKHREILNKKWKCMNDLLNSVMESNAYKNYTMLS